MKNKINRLIKLTRALVKAINRARTPLFSCKKSKHTYTQRQHSVILCLMKRMKTDYRGVIEQLELMPQLKQIIGLKGPSM